MPDSLPRARTRSSTLRVETPSIHAEQITAHLGLVHPPAGVEQGGEERPRAQLGDGELDLPGGGGHRLEALAVAPVGALRRALVALRADHGGGLGVDQILQPGLEQTPEDLVVSKIGVGQDFPDQRGHGRLVTGHRGCTPCESWSKNWGSHDAPTRADDPGRKPRGNCHHTKRRTRGGGHHLPFMGVLGDDSSQDYMAGRYGWQGSGQGLEGRWKVSVDLIRSPRRTH